MFVAFFLLRLYQDNDFYSFVWRSFHCERCFASVCKTPKKQSGETLTQNVCIRYVKRYCLILLLIKTKMAIYISFKRNKTNFFFVFIFFRSFEVLLAFAVQLLFTSRFLYIHIFSLSQHLLLFISFEWSLWIYLCVSRRQF